MPIVNVMKEKEMQNAYIGEVWQPGENTLMYLNFWTTTWDLVDRSPNSSNVVASRRNNSYTCFEQWTNWYHLNFPWNYNYMVDVADNSTIRWADNWYIWFWFMIKADTGTTQQFLAKWYDSLSTWITIWYGSWKITCRWRNDSSYSSQNAYVQFDFTLDSVWHRIGWSIEWKVWKIYLDGELKATKDMSAYTMNYNWNTYPRHIWGQIYSSYTQRYYPLNWKIDELIMENVWWSAQEEQAYFDATKTNYGL